MRSVDENVHTCLWDLLGSLPTLADPDLTVLDETRAADRRSRAPTFRHGWSTTSTASWGGSLNADSRRAVRDPEKGPLVLLLAGH